MLILIGSEKKAIWVRASNGRVPENAVPCECENGENLYIGRTMYKGCLTVGKIEPSHGLYIPFDEKEDEIKDYEVLVESDEKLQKKETTQQQVININNINNINNVNINNPN